MSVPRILVVEDNPLTRKMLRLSLESDGYAVVEAPDGRTALSAVEREVPALVLQDLILPDMNGFELLKLLRARCRSVPIVALSGFLNRVEDARSAEEAFTALLLKPVEPSRLLETIRAYVPRPEPRASGGEGRRVLVVDDDPVQRRLTRQHLMQKGFLVDTADSGSKALAQARAHPPDVVLSDVLMTGLDGFQLCSELRTHPELSHIPVVLASAWYETSADQALAKRVGATALVRKTPDLGAVLAALPEAIERGAPKRSEAPDVGLRLQHAQVLGRQLERQLSLSNELVRRCTLQAAQISLLSGVADALRLHSDTDTALRDVLAAMLDASGISKGALLMLGDSAAPVELRHAIGFAPTERAGLAAFFGHVELLVTAARRQTTLSIPSPRCSEEVAAVVLGGVGAASAQIVPLVSDGRGLGVLVLCATHTDMTSEDVLAFARAMGNQVAQALDLARTFSRLTASERRYRAVTEAAHEAISILSPDGVILETNESFAKVLGVPRDQLVGRRMRDLASPGHDGDAGGHSIGEGAPLALSKSDGSVVLLELTRRSVDLGSEKIELCIGRDVTERVNTQAQLMFSDRMASIGALSAGVAHEINNPLTATVANLEMAREELDELVRTRDFERVPGLRSLLVDAAEGAGRVRGIARDLKMFSRADEDKLGPVDLRSVLESSLRMAQNEIRHRAGLVRDYATIPRVNANESRLGQVFLNLILNAAQALPEGHAHENEIRVRTGLGADGRVVTEIEDTGPGIPAEVRHRVFTPFFTTKPRGVGTGLGLAICRQIVTGLGGEISFETTAGGGTVFRVVLQSTKAEARGAVEARRVVPPPRRGRILVVDDDEMSARVIDRALRRDHEISTALDADSGLDLIRSGSRFDVILCDLMMPVKTGVEFYADLSRLAPEDAVKVIFVTGGAFTLEARQFLEQVPNEVVEKPFLPQALRGLVNRRLGSASSARAVAKLGRN